MKKKKKFNLEEIKIQSFVTSLNDDEKKGIKGGFTIWVLCPGPPDQSDFPIFCP